MILQIFPDTSFDALDLAIAEQEAYYGQINAHVVSWLRSKLERKPL